MKLLKPTYRGVRYLQFNLFQFHRDLIHGIFLRHGSFSKSPFASLNVSFSLDEEVFAHVVRNRYLTLDSLNIAHYPCATMWIIHSANVLTLSSHQEWLPFQSDWPMGTCKLDHLGYLADSQLQTQSVPDFSVKRE